MDIVTFIGILIALAAVYLLSSLVERSGKKSARTPRSRSTAPQARTRRPAGPTLHRPGRDDFKVVVWRCPGCGHLSRLHAMCDWCTTLRPDDADVHVVMHSTYMRQFDT